MDVAWYCLSPWSHDLRPLFPRYPVKCSVSPSEISSLVKSCWPTRETNRMATPRCERRHRFLRDTIRGHLTRRRKPPSKIHNVRLCVLNQYPPGSDSQWPVPSNGITVALPFGHRPEFSSTYTTFSTFHRHTYFSVKVPLYSLQFNLAEADGIQMKRSEMLLPFRSSSCARVDRGSP